MDDVTAKTPFEQIPDLPFRIDAEAIALRSNFTFRTIAGDLDLLADVEPLGGFEELAARAETIPLGDLG